jgi:hypothetical protein
MRNILSKCSTAPQGSILRRTELAKSAKKRSLADKQRLSAVNPYNLIKHKSLIGVAASKTDQYPSTL